MRKKMELIKYLLQKYNLSRVEPHRALHNTSFPGEKFPFDEIKNAVYKYQQDDWLQADGLAGQHTIASLNAKIAELDKHKVDTVILDFQYACNLSGYNLAEDGI
ncbi:hypothetical protein IAI10_17705 [Clostridium sp. 19966]|uniref:hypothetical protein n=1 Tax=Clostridium sp. 19966 TaxID=2768166 RepID=UPI0028DEBFA9|nr:hypothetical protein [Clostridium sp. 19966]MDT8718504.1 hypothetical protein [Clostridium sp. 19966]